MNHFIHSTEKYGAQDGIGLIASLVNTRIQWQEFLRRCRSTLNELSHGVDSIDRVDGSSFLEKLNRIQVASSGGCGPGGGEDGVTVGRTRY